MVSPVAVGLRTDARVEPLGIDSAQPELSWQWTADAAGYRIQVSESDHFGDPVWDSGDVLEATPFGVGYGGPALRSRHRYAWRVATAGSERWSETAHFETAFLAPDVPDAAWIGAPAGLLDDTQVLYLNRRIDVPRPVARARLYASALGWYRFLIDGRDVTEGAQVPRWTPLGEVVEYQAYDVTDDLAVGGVALAMAVADGRYRGYLGGERRRARFGDRLAGFARLEVDFTDGSRMVVATDETWAAGAGRIRSADPQSGEVVDLRIADDAWLAGDATGLEPAVRIDGGGRALVAEEVARVVEVATLRGTVTTAPSGAQLVDFGQNMTGVVRLRLTGPTGSRVRITHSELLTPEGELNDRYLWDARTKDWWQRDEVILDGDETWYRPWFAIRGFRFVEVVGLERELAPDDIQGIVLSTDLAPASTFTCSDERVTKLYDNVVWSMRGNFLDTATDCPTRERAGWTGDAQVFAPTAAHLMDVQAYFRRYLRNLRVDQLDDGTVPPFIPNQDPKSAPRRRGIVGSIEAQLRKSTGWGDASVLIPWAMHQAYGDVAVLRDSYDSMVGWVGYLEREAASKRGRARWLSKRLGPHDRFIIGSGHHFGEWLRPDDGTRQVLQLVFAPASVVATAYFAHAARTLAHVAEVLDREHDAARYHALADRVRAAWRAAFLRSGGSRIGEDKQDDYVRALAFGLLEPSERAAAVERLVQRIRDAGWHVGTGFLSTAMLLPVLVEHGRADVAYRLLLQRTAPSWMSQVDAGATTVWEKWVGFTSDGRGAGSHNHYSFGAVAGWLIEGIAGISALEPGYRTFRIAPVMGGGLGSAAATQMTPFGRITSSWWLDDGSARLSVVVPHGTTARVHHGDTVSVVGAGAHTFTWTDDGKTSR